MSFHKFLWLILSIKSAHFISTNCLQMLSVLKTERTRPDLTRFILVVVRRRKKKKFKKDQKRKNRRSTPQCLVDIISKFAFLFRTKYLKLWFHKIFDQSMKRWRNFSWKGRLIKNQKWRILRQKWLQPMFHFIVHHKWNRRQFISHL